MMRIDSACRAEIVLRRSRIELVQRQQVFTGKKFYTAEFGSHRDCSPHTAERTRASARRVQPVSEFDFKLDCLAMASRTPNIFIGSHRPILDCRVET